MCAWRRRSYQQIFHLEDEEEGEGKEDGEGDRQGKPEDDEELEVASREADEEEEKEANNGGSDEPKDQVGRLPVSPNHLSQPDLQGEVVPKHQAR